MLISKTYSIVIPNSVTARKGEASDEGFEFADKDCNINQAINEIDELSCVELQVDGPTSIRLSTYDPEIDYSDCAETYYTLHIDGTKEELAQILAYCHK